MLMHEWIRYRNQQVKPTSQREDEADQAPAQDQPGDGAGEPEAAEAELVAEPDQQVAEPDPSPEADLTAQEPEVTVAPAPPAQAPAPTADSTDRDRERVLSSLHDELERAGRGIRERVQQLQARQKQLPIDIEEPEEDEDEERPRRASETRQELVQRLLDPTLTLREASLLLDVCPTTVRRYTNRGLLNCFRTPGNQRRFYLSDVLEFMERRERGEI